MTSRAARRLIGIPILTLIACPLAAVDGVSPGAPDRILPAPGACPTFSWVIDDTATAHEIAVYSIAGDDRLAALGQTASPAELFAGVLFKQLPGKATSWSPSAGECFAPGGRFVWFIRAISDEATGDWSSGRYFSTPAAPTLDEVERALAVLEAWQQSRGVEPVFAGSSAVASSAMGEPAAAPLSEPAAARDVSTGIPAIRGEQPDLIGETYGVVGIAASPDGAGIGAANLDGGPDLVLDGTADGTSSTELYEWGIERTGATDQPFTIRNSGSGNLALEVVGPLTATIFRGDGSALTNVTAARAGDADMLDGQHGSYFLDLGNMSTGILNPRFYSAIADLDSERLLDNDDGRDLLLRDQADARFVDVAGDTMTGGLTVDAGGTNLVSLVTSADELSEVVKIEVRNAKGGTIYSVDSEGDVAGRSFAGDGSGLTGVTSNDLDCVGCIGYEEIATQGVVSSDIANLAVTTAKINDNAVTEAKIANDAVTAAKIATGAVGSAEILANSITAADLAANSVGSSEMADNAIGSAEIIDGSVATADLADDAVTSAKIADGAIDNANLAVNAVDSTRILNASIETWDLKDNVITSQKIGPSQVGTSDLGSAVVTGEKIANDAVNTQHLAASAVTSAEIAFQTIVNSDLAPDAVTGPKILNGTITVADIANASINSDKILNGTITAVDVSASGGVYASKASVYTRTVSESVSPGFCDSGIAACDDTNDLPLHGFWSSPGPLTSGALRWTNKETQGWSSTSLAAAFSVTVCNDYLTLAAFEVTIVCLAVPGP